MTEPAVPVGTLTGTLVPSPTDTIAAGDVKIHAFCNVIRELVRASPLYHSEAVLDAATGVVNEFERHFLTGSHTRVIREDDPAPREDVSMRQAPAMAPGTAVVPAGAGLDYNKLAAAIVALQRQNAAEATGETPETEGTPE